MSAEVRQIDRTEFETAGWRVIEIARGEINLPDGKAEYSVRLQAQPGDDGDVHLIIEDVNSGATKNIKLRRGV